MPQTWSREKATLGIYWG